MSPVKRSSKLWAVSGIQPLTSSPLRLFSTTTRSPCQDRWYATTALESKLKAFQAKSPLPKGVLLPDPDHVAQAVE